MIPTAEEQVQQESQQQQSTQSPFKTGAVSSLFDNSTAKITFDGEAAESGKQYAYLSGYVPTVGDRVLLASVSGTYIVLGKIGYNVSPGGGTGSSLTVQDLIITGTLQHSGSKIGFFGSTPVAQATGISTVSSTSSMLTEWNDLIKAIDSRTGAYGFIR